MDVQKIIENKIKDMVDSGKIQKTIEENIEKAIEQSLQNAIGGYSLRNELEKEIEKGTRKSVLDIGLSAYNTMIIDEIEQIIKGCCTEDLKSKIKARLNKILLAQKEKVSIYDINNEYHGIIDNMEDYEKYEKLEDGNYYVDYEFKNSFIEMCFAPSKNDLGSSKYSTYTEETVFITFFKMYGEENMYTVCGARYNGKDISNKTNIRHLNSFGAYLLNLILNRTPVEICEEDIENLDTCVLDI